MELNGPIETTGRMHLIIAILRMPIVADSPRYSPNIDDWFLGAGPRHTLHDRRYYKVSHLSWHDDYLDIYPAEPIDLLPDQSVTLYARSEDVRNIDTPPLNKLELYRSSLLDIKQPKTVMQN